MTRKNIPGDIGTDQIPSGNCLWYYDGRTRARRASLSLPLSVSPPPSSLSLSLLYEPPRRRRRARRPRERSPRSLKLELARPTGCVTVIAASRLRSRGSSRPSYSRRAGVLPGAIGTPGASAHQRVAYAPESHARVYIGVSLMRLVLILRQVSSRISVSRARRPRLCALLAIKQIYPRQLILSPRYAKSRECV